MYIYIYIYIYIRVRGFPLNGIFGPCAYLLAGGCGAWHLLARRRRRRRRHSVPVPLADPKLDNNQQQIHQIHAPTIQDVFFYEGAEPPEAITTSRTVWGDLKIGKTYQLMVDILDICQPCQLLKLSNLKS